MRDTLKNSDDQEKYSLLSVAAIRSIKMALGALVVMAGTATAQAQGAASYGGARIIGPAYTFQGKSGQAGNVTFFGAPPRTLPTQNGQVGNVTFLNGARPFTPPARNGQVGTVTIITPRATGAVPVRTIPTPGIVRIR